MITFQDRRYKPQGGTCSDRCPYWLDCHEVEQTSALLPCEWSDAAVGINTTIQPADNQGWIVRTHEALRGECDPLSMHGDRMVKEIA